MVYLQCMQASTANWNRSLPQLFFLKMRQPFFLPKDEAPAGPAPSPSQAKTVAGGRTASKLYACMVVAFSFLARIMTLKWRKRWNFLHLFQLDRRSFYSLFMHILALHPLRWVKFNPCSSRWLAKDLTKAAWALREKLRSWAKTWMSKFEHE